jgi:hypothetical protein
MVRARTAFIIFLSLKGAPPFKLATSTPGWFSLEIPAEVQWEM